MFGGPYRRRSAGRNTWSHVYSRQTGCGIVYTAANRCKNASEGAGSGGGRDSEKKVAPRRKRCASNDAIQCMVDGSKKAKKSKSKEGKAITTVKRKMVDASGGKSLDTTSGVTAAGKSVRKKAEVRGEEVDEGEMGERSMTSSQRKQREHRQPADSATVIASKTSTATSGVVEGENRERKEKDDDGGRESKRARKRTKKSKAKNLESKIEQVGCGGSAFDSQELFDDENMPYKDGGYNGQEKGGTTIERETEHDDDDDDDDFVGGGEYYYTPGDYDDYSQ